ncbi:glycosyltransferase family 4 protein [Plesiomonas shigelloides]|uniref:glycosyltransferase family 4 protein n=1 Tax=Plesiomonas shigelloides TaxID=703 RepID=UPI00351CD39D
MKILLVNKFFFRKGGAETVLFQEREMLQAAGVEVIDFSMQHARNFPSPQAVFFVSNVELDRDHNALDSLKIAANFIHNREACAKLAALIRQERPDIVHFHNIYHQLTPSIIRVAKQMGCKTVLTAHDLKIACPSYKMLRDGKPCELCSQGSVWNATRYRCQDGSLGKSLLLSLEAQYHLWRKSYQDVDVFIAPSQFMAGMIRRRLPHADIRVIVNGMDASAITPAKAEDDQGYFLFLGRLMPEKGVETLAKAQQKMRHPAALHIVGEGPLQAHLQQHYPHAQLLGFMQGEALNAQLRHCRAVVVPSEIYENCSMSVLEGMAWGKPVLGTRIGGIPEQIRDGEEGFLFGFADVDELAAKMDILAQDSALAHQMGRHARQHLLDNYTLQAHQAALLALYRELHPE